MNQMFKKASSVFTAIVCAASITFSGASLVLADGEIDEQTKTTIETTAEGLTNTIIPLTEDEIAAYMESGEDRKSTRLNSSHSTSSRMPSSA